LGATPVPEGVGVVAVTVKGKALELDPPGLTTVTVQPPPSLLFVQLKLVRVDHAFMPVFLPKHLL
jgi:hypothetical protein